MRLDKIDRKILQILQTQGRITNAMLAKSIGISAPATLERVKRLESSGVISGFKALIDPERVGIGIIAFVRVSLVAKQLPKVEAFQNAVQKLDEVLEAYQVSGDDDYILKVALPSMKAFRDFAFKKMAGITGVQSIKSTFVLGTIKANSVYPMKFEVTS